MDCTSLSKSGYGVYVRYFLNVNEKMGKVKSTEFKSAKEYFAVGGELSGIKNMWQIALDSKDASVSESASSMLNSLHQYINPDSLKAKLVKVREDYLRYQHLSIKSML